MSLHLSDHSFILYHRCYLLLLLVQLLYIVSHQIFTELHTYT